MLYQNSLLKYSSFWKGTSKWLYRNIISLGRMITFKNFQNIVGTSLGNRDLKPLTLIQGNINITKDLYLLQYYSENYIVWLLCHSHLFTEKMMFGTQIWIAGLSPSPSPPRLVYFFLWWKKKFLGVKGVYSLPPSHSWWFNYKRNYWILNGNILRWSDH